MSTKNYRHDLLDRVWAVTRYVDDRSAEAQRTNRALHRLDEFYRYYLPEEPSVSDDDIAAVEAYEAQAAPALEKALAALTKDDRELVDAVLAGKPDAPSVAAPDLADTIATSLQRHNARLKREQGGQNGPD